MQEPSAQQRLSLILSDFKPGCGGKSGQAHTGASPVLECRVWAQCYPSLSPSSLRGSLNFALTFWPWQINVRALRMCHFCSVMVVPAFLDLINPVKPHTFTFAHNFSLKEKNKSKMLAALADGWSEGEQWQMAVFTGKAFISYIWWCCQGFCQEQLGVSEVLVALMVSSCQMKWIGSASKGSVLGTQKWDSSLQLRCSRGLSPLNFKIISERFRSFPVCSKFCFSV